MKYKFLSTLFKEILKQKVVMYTHIGEDFKNANLSHSKKKKRKNGAKGLNSFLQIRPGSLDS
jgi:hypothetical protein